MTIDAVCEYCGKPASCLGQESGEPSVYACDECCGHGCEAGRCVPLDAESIRQRVNELETQNAKLRESVDVAAEREACAKLADAEVVEARRMRAFGVYDDSYRWIGYESASEEIARVIRARGAR